MLGTGIQNTMMVMEVSRAPEVFERITQFLTSQAVEYQVMDHAPTRTSEEAAEIRGTSLSSGAKALLMKLYSPQGDFFGLMVFPAHLRLDSKLARKLTGSRKTRFATPGELLRMTNLKPGSVPPFGEPVLPVRLFVDQALIEMNEEVSFNAGSLTRSIIMSAKDYERISGAQFGHFAK
jgi:Ala-tRNA(Pro) deacylase